MLSSRASPIDLTPSDANSHIVTIVFPNHLFETRTTATELIHDWTSGFVVGGGVELRVECPMSNELDVNDRTTQGPSKSESFSHPVIGSFGC
jgi:hypothetical protein